MTVALELGLVDAERGLVLNTSNGQQLSLTVILETGLLATPKLSLDLIEALELGLYSDETGLFVDPFTKQSLSLQDAINSGLLDPSTTMVKDPHNGSVVALVEAIRSELVDATAGRLVHHGTQSKMNLLLALQQGLLMTAHARVSQGCGCTTNFVQGKKGVLLLATLQNNLFIMQYASNQTKPFLYLNPLIHFPYSKS